MWADATSSLLVWQNIKPTIDGRAGFNNLRAMAFDAAAAALVPWYHCGSCPTSSFIEDSGVIISLRVFAQIECEHTTIAASPCAQRMRRERS